MPVIQRQWTDFSPGVLQVTGSSLDVGIAGSGFFAVNGSNGPLYTRNGTLKVLASGNLATADGFSLRSTSGGTIKISPGSPIEISTAGTVRQDGQSLGQIQVVSFKSTDSLSKVGNTCFQNSDPTNPPVAAADTEVQQGKLEGSNV